MIRAYSRSWTSAALTLCLVLYASLGWAQTASQTFTGNGTFVLPTGVTQVTVECYGAGGGGGRSSSFGATRGGGGGGAYARSVVTLSPGSYAVTVGTGGTGGNLTAAQNSGGASSFGANLVLAAGGTGVANNNNAAGPGGTIANSIGTIRFAGGNGANGGGGGGGGGAGSTQNGTNGSGGTGGAGGATGGGAGGDGGGQPGEAGTIIGGGGGGAGRLFSNQNGGPGARGQVRVTWDVPCPIATFTPVENCASNSYTMAVNVTRIGAGGSLAYSVDGIPQTPIAISAVGSYTLPPSGSYSVLQNIAWTLTSADTPSPCTAVSGSYTSTCPWTVDCGSVQSFNYCYGNNESRVFTFATDPSETITIRFLSPSPTLAGDEVFFQNPPYLSDAFGGGNGADLADAGEFVSDGNEARFRIQTNGSGSCQDLGLTTPWTFEVLCTPSCVGPSGSAVVTNDCANGQFSFDVSIDDPGDATTVGIQYSVDGGTPVTLPNQVLYDPINLGPFAITSSVVVVLLHEDESLCNVTLPLIVRDPFDPCTPTNDLCASAQALTVNIPANCPANAVIGSTFDAGNESGTPSCTGAGGIQDVWYSFTTGNTQSPYTVGIVPTAISGVGHIGIEVYTPGCAGTLLGCYNATLPSPTTLTGLSPYTEYRLRVFTNIAEGAAGNYNICLSAPAAASTCGNTYRDHAGTGNYGNNRNDITYLCPSNPGEKVRLVFSQFDVAAGDALTIYNGPNTSSPVIGTYTGTSLPAEAISSDVNGCLTLRFSSNASGVAAGYTAAAYCCTLPLHTAAITLQQACLGNSFNLLGLTDLGNVFSWTGPNGFTSSVQNPVITNVTGAAAGTYTLTVNNSISGCGPVRATAIQGLIPPKATHTVSISPLTSCVGGEATIVATATAGAFFQVGSVNNTSTPIADALIFNIADGETNIPISITGSGGNTFNAASGSVRVLVNAEHTFTGDLKLQLIGPGNCGTLELANGLGGGGDNYSNTVFLVPGGGPSIATGSAPFTGTWSPQGAATALNGCAVDGTWNLRIFDTSNGDTGTLLNWGLDFTGIGTNGLPYSHSATGPSTVGATSLSGSNANSSVGTIVVSNLVAGANTFQVTTTANSGCSVTSSVTVTTGVPLVAAINGPAAITACSGAPRTHSSTVSAGGPPYNYSWTYAGDPVGGNSASLNFTPTASGALVLTVTDNCGDVVVTNPVNYTITAQPTLSITQSAPAICGGVPASVALNATGDGVSYAWSPAAGLSNTSIANPTAAPSVSTTYTVVATGANGCTTAGSVFVGRGSVPTGVTAGSSAAITCPGGTVNLNSSVANANGPVTPGTVSGTNTSSVAVPDNNATGVTRNIAISGAFGAVVDASTTILATVNLNHTWDGDVEIFLIAPNGQKIFLSNRRGGSGDNYTNTRFNFPSAAAGISTGTPPFNGIFSPDGSINTLLGSAVNGTWGLQVTDRAGGDTGTLQNWSITINYAAPSQALTYAWASSPSGFTSAVRNPSGVVVPENTTYTVTATNLDACSASASTTVNVYPDASVGGPQTICDGATSAALGANTPVAGSGAWSVISGGTGTFSSVSSPNATFTHTGGAGPVVLRWTITNPPCDPTSADMSVSITPQPTVAEAGPAQSSCTFPGNATLAANTPTIGVGAWTQTGGPVTATIANAASASTGISGMTSGGTYTFTWTISNAPCAASVSSVTISVSEATTWYLDQDNDNYGDPANSVLACSQPVGHVANSLDDCPTFFGQQGDVCDANPDPNAFQLGIVTPACTCEPQNTTEDLVMVIQTDANPGQITWEITPDNNANLVLCSGNAPAFAVNQTVFNFCSLPEGCFKLRVFDSGGDGFTVGTQGGYELRYSGAVSPNQDDKRVIDNSRNFTAAFNGYLSAIGGGPSAFCLPMSNQKPLYHHRDRLDFVSSEYLVCEENLDVSAQWEVGDQTQSGYQFWFFDPNGSYSYRRGRTHATSDNFGNVGATRACHMRINNWAAANQIPENVLMNVRIRTRVNGVYGEFGPAYRFKIDPVRAQCKLTKLLDYADSPYESCNSTRSFGPNNRVHARAVPGANKYQFRFRIPAENFVVARTSNTYFLELNWATDPLVAGKTYVVDVRASKDGGATWCTSFIAPALTTQWGELCNLTIVAQAQDGEQNIAIGGNDNEGLRMWPNPNRSEQLWLSVATLGMTSTGEEITTVTVDIFDMTGKRIIARQLPTQGNNLNTVLELNGDLAAGLYMVNVTAGNKTWNQRLVIAH